MNRHVCSFVAFLALSLFSPISNAGYPDGWRAEDYRLPSMDDLPKMVNNKTVRVVYFTPSDRAIRLDYRNGAAAGILEFQDWLSKELDGKTFKLNDPIVETCQSNQPHSYFVSGSFTKVGDALRGCGLNWQYSDPNFVWVVYADVLHGCDMPGRLGVGAPGITIMPVQDLQGLEGQTQINDDCGNSLAGYRWTRDRWIGGLGHEIGHAFGLPHPPGCDTSSPGCDSPSLMWLGYITWPATYYRAEDRATLANHPILQTAGGNTIGPSSFEQLNGVWFNPARSGEGAVVSTGVSSTGVPIVVFTFYTYTDGGQQEYVVGSKEIPTGTSIVTVPAVRTEGTVFGAGFDPNDVIRTPWGNFELSMDTCNTLIVRSIRADGVVALSRMERIARTARTSVCVGTY